MTSFMWIRFSVLVLRLLYDIAHNGGGHVLLLDIDEFEKDAYRHKGEVA
jgi:hypothetical protein